MWYAFYSYHALSNMVVAAELVRCVVGQITMNQVTALVVDNNISIRKKIAFSSSVAAWTVMSSCLPDGERQPCIIDGSKALNGVLHLKTEAKLDQTQ